MYAVVMLIRSVGDEETIKIFQVYCMCRTFFFSLSRNADFRDSRLRGSCGFGVALVVGNSSTHCVKLARVPWSRRSLRTQKTLLQRYRRNVFRRLTASVSQHGKGSLDHSPPTAIKASLVTYIGTSCL